MMRSLFTGVSGLKQHQIRMDVLSNNIANVNTTGFKKGRAMFQDLFSQTLRHAQQAFDNYGGLNPMQVGLGVRMASIDTLMEQGTLETTGKNTDLAIEGNGFFVVKNQNGADAFTRDGNLSINPSYDLVATNTGLRLQGWMSQQNAQTGNLEIKDTGVVPDSINLVRYLKKHAHQTNNITYASNLDSGSDERDIEFGMDTLTYKDNTGEFQSLKMKFKKIDSTHWVWSATDDTQGNVANGYITTDTEGNITASTVEPAGTNMTVGNPFFTYDPDGVPMPASASGLVNATTNAGNGSSSDISASGTEVVDETISVVFDGGDPTRATSYRVVGSERGFIGSGILGGAQATLQGNPVTFGGTWNPANDVSFTVNDRDANYPTPLNFSRTLTGGLFSDLSNLPGGIWTPSQDESFEVSLQPSLGNSISTTVNFTAGTPYSANDVANILTAAINGASMPATVSVVGSQVSVVPNSSGDTLKTISPRTADVTFPRFQQGSLQGTMTLVGGTWTPTNNLTFDVVRRTQAGSSFTTTIPFTAGTAYTPTDVQNAIQAAMGGNATVNLVAGNRLEVIPTVSSDSLSITNVQPATPNTDWDNLGFRSSSGYTTSQIVETLNQAFEANGLRTTAYYDSVTQRFQLVSNEAGDTKELSITNAIGPFSDLQLPTGPNTGLGGTKPEVFTDNTVVGGALESDDFVPSADIQFTVTDRNNHVAAIQLPAVVAGVQQHYTRSAILSTINSQLAANNVNASATMVDTDDDGTPDQMLIQGKQTGAGETLTISDVTNINLLGLGTGQFRGTAATSTFDQGGLHFTLTEGTNGWVPNDSMTMSTTGEKGQAESVNIFVPQPNTKVMGFSTTVNGEKFEITGAVNKGALHSTSIAVYDSLGAAHNFVTTWEHTNKETQEWTYKLSYDKDDPEITAWMKDPANGVVDPKEPTDEEYDRANTALIGNRTGKIYFQNNGKIDLAKSYTPAATMTPKGSNPITISLDCELITQFNSGFTTAAREQDGYEMGLLESVYFEQDGTIRGVYSNGQKQPIGLLALATFNNPSGLEKMGKNMYMTSPNSGMAVIGRPAVGDRGIISPGSLEMSNVDIAEEFTNMITTQRAFQANSRVITTSDELLQEVVNLKR